jgi:hypothetical protein
MGQQSPKQHFNSEFFMEIFMLGGWLIWKQRWKRGFIEEAMNQANRLQYNKQATFFSLVNLYK